MLHLILQEESGIPWYAVVFALIVIVAVGSFFFAKHNEDDLETTAITTSRGEAVSRVQVTANVPVTAKKDDPPTTAATPLSGAATNAALAARQQIRAQIQSGGKLTSDPIAMPAPIDPAVASQRMSVTATDMLHEAEVQRSAGRLDLATKKVRELLLREPKNAAALELLGDLLMATGDHVSAADAFRESAHANPSSGRPFMSLAKTLENIGDIKGAIAAYRSAAVADPTDHKAYNNLGGLLAETGDIEGGVEAFRKALEISPNDATAKENLHLAEELLRESTAKT